MSNLLNPKATPTRTKRLNKVPLVVGFILLLAVAGAFLYMIQMSSARQKQRTVEEKAQSYNPATTAANEFLAGKQQFGSIGAEKAKEPPKHIENNKGRIGKKEQEISPEEKELTRIREEKIKKYEQAVNAPTSVRMERLNNGGAGNVVRASSKTSFSLSGANGQDRHSEIQKLKDKLREGLLSGKEPNDQDHKTDFLESQSLTEYLPHTRKKQISPLEVKTGTVIPATMLTGLNSDLPGMILAQVSQNVYDTASGKYLLIPQGSRLVGKYDSYIAYGQRRALVVWNRIVYPDGSTIELAGMPGTDQGGFAGFEDQVDNHYMRIFGSAILMSFITGAYEYTQQDDTTTTNGQLTAGQAMSQAVAQQLTQTSQELLRRNLHIQPTIVIRHGYKFNVMVGKDILFPDVWQGENG